MRRGGEGQNREIQIMGDGKWILQIREELGKVGVGGVDAGMRT
jgi:hypothetical protein